MALDQNYKALLTLLVSAAGALITAIATTSSGSVSDVDAKNWLIALASVLGSSAIVWWVENIHGTWGGVAKAILSFLGAGVASLVIALDDNVISQAEWLTAFATAVVATGLVYQTKGPDTSPSTTG
jgi:peptidoglycan/LPS O-acetylase OafA/YrhL